MCHLPEKSPHRLPLRVPARDQTTQPPALTRLPLLARLCAMHHRRAHRLPLSSSRRLCPNPASLLASFGQPCPPPTTESAPPPPTYAAPRAWAPCPPPRLSPPVPTPSASAFLQLQPLRLPQMPLMTFLRLQHSPPALHIPPLHCNSSMRSPPNPTRS